MIINRQKEIIRKLNLPKHLKELSVLADRQVSTDELIALNELEPIQKAIGRIPESPIKKFKLPFIALKYKDFKIFVQDLYLLNPIQVLVWTTMSIECGPLLIDDILHVNFDFSFDSIKGEVFSITTCDNKDKLLVDLMLDDCQQETVEITLTGTNWTHIAESWSFII